MSSTWWYVARSSGIVAWGLLALSVLWGLALSTRALGRRPRASWLLDLHRFLGGLAVLFVGIHLLSLALDPWVDIGALQVLVPFTSGWSPGAVAWGVVALYLLAAVELTSLLRRRLSRRLWKGVHLASYGLYVVATIHLLAAGTDAGSPVLRWTVAATTATVVGFTTYRVVGPGRPAGGPRTVPARNAVPGPDVPGALPRPPAHGGLVGGPHRF